MMKKGGCSFEHVIIGLFRSTVLLVMSQTRFLCATMMVVIVWFRSTSSDFLLVARYHYAKMTFTSFSGFDPLPPPSSARSHYAKMTCLIYAPPSHISVIDFTMSRLTT